MKKVNFKSLWLILEMLCVSIGVSAYDFEVDGINYSILSGVDKTCEVKRNYSYEYTGDIVIPSVVSYNSIEYKVIGIGDWAFSYCSGLTSINIPNSVSYIGEYAFAECTGLTSINIPNSVSDIGVGAFRGCVGLTSINIPNSISIIGGGAFERCFGLTSINIPNSVSSIGDYTFYCCSGLTSINIPNSVSSIGKDAFAGCSGLTSINIPNSVSRIGEDAFEQCSGLTSINIPNSVNSIGDGAFRACSGLTMINIPNSVSSIGYAVFEQCSGLTSINIPNSISSIGSLAFSGCSTLTTVDIPNSIVSIGGLAFSECPNLTILNYNAKSAIVSTNTKYPSLPNTITTLNIGNEVETLPSYFVYSCTLLKSVIIPNSVVSIGSCAFNGCDNIKEIHSKNQLPPLCDTNSFDGLNTNQTRIYVPEGSKEYYSKADGWKDFLYIAEEKGDDDGSDVVESLKAEIASLKETIETLKENNTLLKDSNALLKESLSYYQLGDLNKDGVTNIDDVAFLLKMDSYSSSVDALAVLSESNAISLEEISEKWGDVEFYTLNGIKVNQPSQSGIYIVKKEGQTKMIVVKK